MPLPVGNPNEWSMLWYLLPSPTPGRGARPGEGRRFGNSPPLVLSRHDDGGTRGLCEPAQPPAERQDKNKQ